MVLTVNIPNNATATIDAGDNIRISLLVNIMDGAVVYDSKTLTIEVYLRTANVRTVAEARMIDAISQYKAICVKKQTIDALMPTFTTNVRNGV